MADMFIKSGVKIRLWSKQLNRGRDVITFLASEKGNRLAFSLECKYSRKASQLLIMSTACLYVCICVRVSLEQGDIKAGRIIGETQ